MQISKLRDQLSETRMMALRDHIGESYIIAELLPWCNPDEHLEFHRRNRIPDKTSEAESDSVIPVVAAKFPSMDKAQTALSQVRDKVTESSLTVYDFHINKNNNAVGVALEPFTISP